MYRPNGLEYFETAKSGEIALTSVSNQLPNVECLLVKFKARGAKVFLGSVDPVTIPNGVTDATTGFELLDGDVIEWLPVNNLNKFYALASASNAGGLTYLALK
jgi:hypothetical protein